MGRTTEHQDSEKENKKILQSELVFFKLGKHFSQ